MTLAPKHHAYTVRVDGEAISDNLGWLHARGQDDDAEEEVAPFPALLSTKETKVRPPAKKALSKSAAIKERAALLSRHLNWNLPVGCKSVPTIKLSQATRKGRARSIDNALLKRKQRVALTRAERNEFRYRGVIAKLEFRTLERDAETGEFRGHQPKASRRWHTRPDTPAAISGPAKMVNGVWVADV